MELEEADDDEVERVVDVHVLGVAEQQAAQQLAEAVEVVGLADLDLGEQLDDFGAVVADVGERDQVEAVRVHFAGEQHA